MNYTLKSLHLATEFDGRVKPLEIPAVARVGSERALSILDGANRAPRRLARLVKPVGLLGLKVATKDGVRVTVALQSDRVATQIWNRMYSKPDEDPVLENEFRNHRLVEVTAQGRTRGMVMLTRRGSDQGPLVQKLTFDVDASEIGESGLLMVGFEEPGSVPEWAAEGLLETPLVGVCVASIKLEPIEGRQIGPRLSGGRPSESPVNVLNRPGFFVVNPGVAEQSVQLTLRPRMRPPRQAGRRANLVARVKNLGRRPTTVPPTDEQMPALMVECVTVTGEQLYEGRVPIEQGAYALDLPAVREAVYVRAAPATAVPRLRGFKARVAPCD